MSGAHRLVIVGSGMAGARLAEEVLARDHERAFDIVMFGDEDGGSYNRILLSGVLAGTHAVADIETHSRSWYASQGVTLHAGRHVAALDLRSRCVVDEDGHSERFDSLVLATGSRPFLPPIEGSTDPNGRLRCGVFVFRAKHDCDRILASAATARRAVVIGGGLLGLEAARGLHQRGLDVCVIHLATHIMDAQLDSIGGRVLQRQLEAPGLQILTGARTRAIVGEGRISAVDLADGTSIPCDLVVIAAGVRPDTRLATQAGLAARRGIVVGDDLVCSGAPGVHAIGDCIEHRERVYGLVAPAWEQAAVLADRLTRRKPDATYTGSRLATKLKVAGLDVAVMGPTVTDDDAEIVTYSEPCRGVYSKLVVREDRIVGAILIGGGDIVPDIVQRYLDGAPVPEKRSELLFPMNGQAPVRAVEAIADTTRICDCNAVTKAQIVDAVLTGARSVTAVCERTRAASGCGSCRPEVQRIVDFTCRTLDTLDEGERRDYATA